MKSIKQNISVFMLITALFSPKIEAMGVWPKVRQVAVTVAKNPNLRTALTQTECGVANTAARTISRTTSKAGDIQPVIQHVSRSFATQVSKAAQKTHRSAARSIAAVVGLAGAIAGGGITYAHAEAQDKDVFPRDFLTITSADSLLALMKENTDYARQFAGLVREDNITKIDVDVLRMIIKLYPQAAKKLTRPAAARIESLAKSWRGRSFLEDLMDCYPEATSQFTASSVAHIESLIDNLNGSLFLTDLMNRYPDAVNQFTTYAAGHIESLSKSWNGRSFLKDLMNRRPETVSQVATYAVAHFESLAQDRDGKCLLQDLIKDYPEAVRQFTTYAITNFKNIMAFYDGITFIKALANENTQSKKELFTASQLLEPGTLQDLISQAKADKNPTPTEAHLAQNGASHELEEEEYDLIPGIRRVVKSVIALEKQYENTHYTFTHGRIRGYDYVSTVYGKLWGYAHNMEMPKDFIFTHTKDEHDPLMQKVLMDGKTSHVMFLNSQLFGNMIQFGSSSFAYFKSSRSASSSNNAGKNPSGMKVMVQDVFAQFDQQALYEKYKDEFESLEKEHAALSGQGELLVVAVPKDRINEDVRCCSIWCHGQAAPEYLINGKMTNNVQDILEARKKDPSIGDNQINFVLNMPEAAVLDQKNGIKIHSVQGVDPKDYAVWQAKLDALMAKIEGEFKTSWQRSLKAKERGHGELLDAVRASQKYGATQK